MVLKVFFNRSYSWYETNSSIVVRRRRCKHIVQGPLGEIVRTFRNLLDFIGGDTQQSTNSHL